MYKVIEKYLTPNKWSRPQKKAEVKFICVHWEAVINARASAVRDFFESRKYGKKSYGSAHEIIDTNGDVWKVIPDNEMAYSVGSKTYTKEKYNMMGDTYPNSVVYSIEVPTINMKGNYSDIVYFIMVERTVDLLIEYNLGLDKVTNHGIISGKDCPKYYCPEYNKVDYSRWNVFLQDVKSLYEIKKGSKKGENMTGERINIKIKMSGEKFTDLEKKTIDDIKDFIDPYEPYTIKVLYMYVGRDILKGEVSDDVLEVQKALTQLGFDVNGLDKSYGNGLSTALYNFCKPLNIWYNNKITENIATAINTALIASQTVVIDEPTVITSEPFDDSGEAVVKSEVLLYNKAIPQLVYKGVINYNKTSSFKSSQILYLQRALQSLGYYRAFSCDKKKGNGTILGIKDLKAEIGLSSHGNTLNEDDIFKINKKLILDFHKYHNGKYGTESWKIPKNSKYTSIVVKVNPSRLDITIGDKAGNRYIESNLITSSYQWYSPTARKMYKYGITMTKGKLLLDGQVHYKPTFTLFSKGGKHFDVKTVLNAKELGNGVVFADAGLELYPSTSAYATSGFTGKYADVIRATKRPYNFKLNGELYFAVHPYMSNKTATRMGKAMVLGFINSWDAGNSTLLKVDGVWYYTTTRRLYQLVKF
jgi:peptidoglycan hydrolase-like protein with peptidoglycan-binding domain